MQPGGLGAVGLAGRRRDAIDHGRGKGDLALEECRKFGIDKRGEAHDRGAGLRPVVSEIVAAHHREGCEARGAPPSQRLDDQRGRAARRLWVGEIGGGERMALVEPSRRGVEPIALFRDREADDAGFRPRQRGEHGRQIPARRRHIEHGADDLRVRPPLVPRQQSVKSILRLQGLLGFGGVEIDAQNSPVAVARRERVLGVQRQMGAREGA